MDENYNANPQPQANPQQPVNPQPQYQQPAYQQPVNPQPQYQQAANAAPVGQLNTNRSLLKFILLSLITLGIYGLVVMCKISTEINTVAQRYDGKKTMHYALVVFVFSWLTLGILPIVWMHNISNRMGSELQRRGLGYNFAAKDYWLWCVLGVLIIVGPFIYYHKFFTAMNKINADYNVNG